MAETTHPTQVSGSPREYAYCSWHHEFSSTARLVTIIEQGSAFGAALYACQACRQAHGLTPVADR